MRYTDIIETLAIILDLKQSERLDSEQSEQEYWGNVRALEVIEGFYNDTQVTSTLGPVDHTPENNNRPPSVIKK